MPAQDLDRWSVAIISSFIVTQIDLPRRRRYSIINFLVVSTTGAIRCRMAPICWNTSFFSSLPFSSLSAYSHILSVLTGRALLLNLCRNAIWICAKLTSRSSYYLFLELTNYTFKLLIIWACLCIFILLYTQRLNEKEELEQTRVSHPSLDILYSFTCYAYSVRFAPLNFL